MRTYRGREALIIAGAFFFALFGSSVRVFFPLGPFLPADYFLALMIFLGFTCRETELFALCLLAALFRDIQSGDVPRPTAENHRKQLCFGKR